MATMIKREKFEKIEGIPDKVTLVVDGIRDRDEGIDIFRQEYLAKERSKDLYVPGVSLEVVKAGDYDAILLRCWYSFELKTVILDIRGKKGFKRHTLKGYLLAKRRVARIREVRQARAERLEEDRIREEKEEKRDKRAGYFGEYV